ncbi:hypothetical protein [Bradyrhizobium vignae]|uniref:hypothetical protein n=1 Tax=Bradyrhizobium vignae TaxID=1549949 RepID=UPI0013E8C904|nr:hypothetical protein [Bradyrhizobium vignae]
MNQQDRKAAIRARMDELIEAIARAICDGKLPVAEQWVLRVREEVADYDQRHQPPSDLPDDQMFGDRGLLGSRVADHLKFHGDCRCASLSF